jgi:uncharacterized protein (DUF488 family)
MKLFTIGFTKKSAEVFFTKLQKAKVGRVIDIRLNNMSQLAGFTKRDDLEYFLRAICRIEYKHVLELAPTQEIMDAYKTSGDWNAFEKQFKKLMAARKVETTLPKTLFDGACLLCSEDKPAGCHRRLVAEYLADRWGGVEIEHIL